MHSLVYKQKRHRYGLVYMSRIFWKQTHTLKAKFPLEKEAEGLKDWSETNFSRYTPLYPLHFLSCSNITLKHTTY